MNPPPFDPGAHDRILREARLKGAAFEEGKRTGAMEASAAFEKRLAELESEVASQGRKLESMWRAFCTDDTRVIRSEDRS